MYHDVLFSFLSSSHAFSIGSSPRTHLETFWLECERGVTPVRLRSLRCTERLLLGQEQTPSEMPRPSEAAFISPKLLGSKLQGPKKLVADSFAALTSKTLHLNAF